MHCYVRDCPNGPKSLKKKKDSDLIKYFSVPEDKNLLEKWRRVIPEGENVLSPKDKLCDAHFLPSEVLWFTETKLSNGNVRRLLRDEPILRPGTIPSIFPAEKVGKENASLPGKERQETPKPIAKNVSSVIMKDKSATPKSIVKNINTVVTEKIETPKSNFRIRFKDPVESSGKRNPKRVKRRSTILDDYWTDDELNQVHNPGASKGAAGSAKKRKTESGLQPVIRLVPLECLMDKTVTKNKTPSKTVVVNRPSTEEIDQELKKVIEIPLMTRLKPNKSMMIRSTKETVQFKPPKRNVSKSKIKIMPHTETLVSHDLVTASPSNADGFNEVKTETPDIEEELARMEMDEESEDVKSVDIVVMNPPLGEDDSVVVKSEEEDDGYSVNEMTANPMMNIPEGDEIPTIKSESEEEQPAAEVDSNDGSDEILPIQSSVPEIVAVAGNEQGSALPSENNDSILTTLEQPNEVPEVQAAVDQNKGVEQPRANEAELVDNSSAMEADGANVSICNKGTEEGEKDKITGEKGDEERVLEDGEIEKNSESRKESEAEIPTETIREEVNTGEVPDDLAVSDKVPTLQKDSQALQGMQPEKKDDESAVETEASQEVEPEKPEGESAMEIEKETLLPENIEEATEPVQNDGTPKPVESEISEEEMRGTADDGKDSGPAVGVSEEPMAETVNETEPSGAELEKNLSDDREILNEDESRSDVINSDLPEAGDETDADSRNETDKEETVTKITTDERPAKPNDDVIDVSDSEVVEPDKGPSTSGTGAEADTVIDVDLSDGADQSPSSGEVTVEQSSASSEVEPDGTNDDCAMETEDGEEPANVQSADDIEDDDVHLDASPVPDGDVTETEKDNETEGEKRDSKQAEQSEIDEMDIEAEVARLVSEVEESAKGSPSKEVENEDKGGNASNSSQDKEKPDKETAAKEASQPQEIVLQDTTNLGGITAAGVQNLFSPETIQEILKQIKLPLTTPVTFRIAPPAVTPSSSSSSSSGRGRGRRKGMRGTNRQVVPRASSSSDASHNSIDLFRHLTRTRTVFDFPTFVTDIDDEIQYWKLCQILKESFHELIETRNTKTSIGKLTLRVAINRPKKPKFNGEPEADPQ